MSQLAPDLQILPWLTVLVPLVTFLAVAWAYVARPRWAGLGPRREGERLGAVDAGIALGAFAVAAIAGTLVVAPSWLTQVDEEADFFRAVLCARGELCPMVGNEMGRLRIPLGPLNRMLMTIGAAASGEPRHVLAAILVGHALAAALLSRVATVHLGRRAGATAGVVFALASLVLDVYVQASNGAWVTLPLVATLWGALRWARGEGGVPFVAAVVAYLCAIELHGTSILLAPGLLAVAIVARPRTPAPAVVVALAACGLMFASWLRFGVRTDFAWLRGSTLSWAVAAPPAGREGGSVLARASWYFEMAGQPALAGAAGGALLAARARRATTRAARTAAWVVVLACGAPIALTCLATALCGEAWVLRYDVPAIPGAALLAGALVESASAASPLAAAALAAVVVVHAAPHRRGLASDLVAWQPGLRELEAAEDALARHGFAIGDVERRVHGLAWTRWNAASLYLGLRHLPHARRGPTGDDALLTSCEPHDGAFARWAEALPPATSGAAPRWLVGYAPTLDAAPVELLLDDGARETSLLPPFYGQNAIVEGGELPAAVDPLLAVAPAWNALATTWIGSRTRGLRLRATIRAGAPERTYTLLAPVPSESRVTFDGREVAPSERLEGGNEAVRRYRRPPGLAPDAPATIEVDVRLPEGAQLPWRLDLFEEPAMPCPLPRLDSAQPT